MEGVEKKDAVPIVLEDRSSRVAAGGDVVERPGIFDPQRPCHGQPLSRTSVKCQDSRPDPNIFQFSDRYHARRSNVKIQDLTLIFFRISPEDPDAHNNLALLLARQGDMEGATAEFREALKIDEQYTNAYYNLGRVMLQQGRPAEATKYFETALELEPGVAEIHEQLARALAQQGRKEEAMHHYEEAVRIMRR